MSQSSAIVGAVYGHARSFSVAVSTSVSTEEPIAIGGYYLCASAFGGGYASTSAGGLVATEYEIGPVTLDYPGGGYTVRELLPLGAANKNVYVILADGAYEGSGERFKIDPGSLVATRAYQCTFRVVRSSQS